MGKFYIVEAFLPLGIIAGMLCVMGNAKYYIQRSVHGRPKHIRNDVRDVVMEWKNKSQDDRGEPLYCWELVKEFSSLYSILQDCYFKMDFIAREAKYECLLFDIDDTLYPMSTGLNLACRKNIQDYMLHHLKIEESNVPRMCVDLYKEYGTTMAGLKILGYEFDDDEFHAYAHGRLPYEILKPDPVLKNLLLSMPQRKIIFTNADRAHAIKVLNRLDLEHCFEGIICFETLTSPTGLNIEDGKKNDSLPANQTKHRLFSRSESESDDVEDCDGASDGEPKFRILCKPSVEAMEAAIKIANVDCKKTLFFDDSVRNIAAGKAAGLNTVIVGRSVHVPGADIALESIHNIKETIPEIWEGEDQQDPTLSTAVETGILA